MYPTDSFLTFFNRHVSLFRLFLLAPKRSDSANNSQLRKMAGLTIIIVYWGVALGLGFWKKQFFDHISMISNWIQLIANSIAFTSTVYMITFKTTTFQKIVDLFQEIDNQLQDIRLRVDYSRHLVYSRITVIFFIIIMCCMLGFEFAVTVLAKQMTTPLYWMVCALPLPVFSMSLLQAMFFIYFIKVRCSLVNEELKKLRNTQEIKGTPNSMNILVVQIAPKLLGEKEILHELINITNDLCKLARKINEMYGVFFVASCFAIFSVTAIQLYYCYLILVSDPNWIFVLPMNLVLWNLGLIVGLTTICERVSDEGQKILQNSLSMHLKDTQLSTWVHPMVSQMRFSAYGFFCINHGMLCSFMAALITYLIIFIQFYGVHGKDVSFSGMKNGPGFGRSLPGSE